MTRRKRISPIQKHKGQFRQGVYTPKHPHKYRGDVSNVVYRSSWELRFCEFCDNNPNMISWSSEEVVVPYIKPTTGRVHKYYVDFFVEYVNKAGEVVTEIVEIKPSNQTSPSTARRAKTRVYENMVYDVNNAKWKAAQMYAAERGWKFRIITELALFR